MGNVTILEMMEIIGNCKKFYHVDHKRHDKFIVRELFARLERVGSLHYSDVAMITNMYLRDNELIF